MRLVHTEEVASAASGYVRPVDDAAEVFAVGVRAGRADRGPRPAVSLS
jgi:hypothetical protein